MHYRYRNTHSSDALRDKPGPGFVKQPQPERRLGQAAHLRFRQGGRYVPRLEAFAEPADEDQPRVDAVAFRPNGKTLASGSNDTTVLIWSPVGDNQEAGARDRCGVRRAVLQTQVPAAALPCAIASATCHGMTAPCPLGCAGRCDLSAEHC